MHTENRPVIYGEVLFDIFPDGSTVLGGAPFNVAWHLQAFGRNPLFISRVGNDSLGRDIRNSMQEWGMDTSGLQLDSSRPTGTVEVRIKGGEPEFEILNDCAYDNIEVESIPSIEAALLYHGTLILRNKISAATFSRLRDRIQSPLFLDVNLRAPWWTKNTLDDSMHGADIVKLNEDELAILGPASGELKTGAKQLLEEYEIEQLIVTRGEHGAIVLEASGSVFEIRPGARAPKVIDTVGAGDAFSSTAILGKLLGWPVRETMERAQQFASAVVGIRGAVVKDMNFYQPFIKDWKLSHS